MKRARVIIIILAAILVTGVSAFWGYIYYNTRGWNLLIYPGVNVEGTDLSGKTKQQARDILLKKYGDNVVEKNTITVKAPSKTYVLDYKKINAKYNIDNVVSQAFDYGKNSNMLARYKIITSPVKKNYNLKLAYDEKPIKEFITSMQKEVDKGPVNGRLVRNGGKFQVVSEESGTKLQTDTLEKNIKSKIESTLNGNIVMDAPVEEVKPEVTRQALSSVDSRISGFTTDFSGSIPERASNIILATKTINGTIVMPGKSFSFNGILGERTGAKGYKEAPVIVGNKVDSGFGGGICQVSTTLYNAVIRANIKSTERTHHTLPSHYIGVGMDATVDYGNLDYKFTNTLSYPIYIEGYIQGGIIGFNIYSNSSLTKRTYDLSTNVYDTIQPQVKYVDDSTLPAGQTQEDQAPSTGYKVKTYKDAYENGKLVEHELLTDDFYKPVDQVIKKGIKK